MFCCESLTGECAPRVGLVRSRVVVPLFAAYVCRLSHSQVHMFVVVRQGRHVRARHRCLYLCHLHLDSLASFQGRHALCTSHSESFQRHRVKATGESQDKTEWAKRQKRPLHRKDRKDRCLEKTEKIGKVLCSRRVVQKQNIQGRPNSWKAALKSRWHKE